MNKILNINFKLKDVSWRAVTIKILAYLVLFYLSIVVISIAITGYLFINLDSYKAKITQFVYENTGFNLEIGKLQTKLNNAYLPELALGDITLSNPKNKDQKSHIEEVDFVLDYSSFWHLQPIFRRIYVNGTAIGMEYESNGSLFINGIQVTDPADQTLENTKILPFDLEGWLLKQKEINLSNISLEFHDKKNHLPEVKFRNIELLLEKSLWSKHHASIELYGKKNGNDLKVDLEWQGGKFEKWQTWKNATLQVRALANNGTMIQNLKTYLPNNMQVESSDVSTAVNASIKDGKLQHIYANFDINNVKLALADVDVINLLRFGGTLDVHLINNDSEYLIKARNLQASTSSGALFDNSQIDGNYVIGRNGKIQLSNTNLVALNNLLSFFDATDGISLQGTINQVGYDWSGYLTNPSEFEFSAIFNNVSLRSNLADLPSISNVSGDVTFNQNSGKLDLLLKDSVLNYQQIFLIPYEFKNLSSKISWKVAKNKVVDVTLGHTILETKDFKGYADGTFKYDPSNTDSSSYINMTAHVDKVLTSKVGDYLPKQIPMSVHAWLNMGLAGGYGESADMILKGPLSHFPFQDNTGLFYITANVDNGKVQYVKDWPPIENVYGKFILKNSNITVIADKAQVSNNTLDKTIVVIPDFSDPNGVSLTADGKAHGSTDNFMTYLKHTPVNDIIGKFPERVQATGNGNLEIHLKVPFREPKHTEVKGVYSFLNNNLKLDLPIPELTNVNGDLGFTQHGVSSNGIHASAFNSNAILHADTNKDNQMHFRVDIPQLDYPAVAEFYLPFLLPLVDGRAATVVDFSIGKKGIETLTAKSGLIGVKLDAPDVFAMESAESKNFVLSLTPERSSNVVVNWRLGDVAHGVQYINGKQTNARGQIAIGTDDYINVDTDALMTINVNMPEVSINKWIATIDKVVKSIKINKLATESSSLMSLDSKTKHNVLPIEVKVVSSHMMLGKTDLESGLANIVVDNNQTYFNMYTPIASGMGNFNYAQNQVKLTLDKYMLYKTAPKINESSLSSVDTNVLSEIKLKIPDISLVINNLFYQNHNIGKAVATVHQEGNNLLLKDGVLTNSEGNVNFHGTNYCFGCSYADSYVNFVASASINNLGNMLYDLDFGRVVSNGSGTADLALQWNGGFQDFKPLGNIGTVHGDFYNGKFLKIDPGVFGAIFSVINMQGLFEAGSGDASDIFKKGFFFNSLETNIALIASKIELQNVTIVGPTAQVQAVGMLDIANSTIDANLAITPHVGFAVALAAGVATLNPFVGLAVYGAELLTGGAQNKLFTLRYQVKGDLRKPTVTHTDTKDNIVKNVGSTVGM